MTTAEDILRKHGLVDADSVEGWLTDVVTAMEEYAQQREKMGIAYKAIIQDLGLQITEWQAKYDAYRTATDIILKDYREQLCYRNDLVSATHQEGSELVSAFKEEDITHWKRLPDFCQINTQNSDKKELPEWLHEYLYGVIDEAKEALKNEPSKYTQNAIFMLARKDLAEMILLRLPDLKTKQP